MFVVADDAYMRADSWFSQGEKRLGIQQPHEVSSELGIPGFLFFAAAVGMALKALTRCTAEPGGYLRLKRWGTSRWASTTAWSCARCRDRLI